MYVRENKPSFTHKITGSMLPVATEVSLCVWHRWKYQLGACKSGKM